MSQLLHQIFIGKKVKKNNLFFLIFLTAFIILSIIIEVDLAGLFSLISVALLTFYISSYYKYLATILYVALSLRLIIILLGIDLIILPDSWGDASKFEARAWEISQDGFFGVFSNFPQDSPAHHFSWILAFFYSLTYRSPIVLQSVCLIFGMASVLLGSQLAGKIWNKEISQKVGWIIALYPTLILYSCLILRESLIWFFLLLALYGITCWVKDKSFKSFIFILIAFGGATFMHGAMIIGGFAFLIIIVSVYFFQIINKLLYLKTSISSLIILIVSITALYSLVTNVSSVPKFQKIKQFNLEFMVLEISKRNSTRDNREITAGPGAAFPEWTVPKTSFELIYKFPIRVVYFLLSPFPWDIKKITHLLGLFDGLFYLMLLIFLIKNFKLIWSDQSLKIIFIILAAYLLTYTFAAGNFGTGLRHRTKFIIVLILLVAPWIPKLVFNKKQRKINNKKL